MKKKKYLLVNAYSVNNRGDAGIVVSMIHLIRKHDQNAEIYVMSSHWKENELFYKEYDVHSVPAVWSLNQNESSLKRYFNGFKKYMAFSISTKSESLIHYNQADIIFSVGGGYIYSSRRGPLGVGLLNSLFHVWLAKKLNKRVISFPQSVGPLSSKIDKVLAKRVLGKVDTFISREKITTDLLKGLGLKNVIEVPDIGFILPSLAVKCTEIEEDTSTYKVGLTLLDWRFARKNSDFNDIESYVEKVAECCQDLMKKYKNISFYIFPQVTVGDGDTDIEVSNLLLDKIGSANCSIIDLDKTVDVPEQLVSLYGKMDVFIGSRMHSTIFALASGTPTLALAYQYKTKGTFELMGAGDYVFDVQAFSSQQLFSTITDILESESYPMKNVHREIANIQSKLMEELNEG
ncbi:polysaccharide pyruvyl transferase family protein [Bacillus luti]